ncbi:hypothetical protein FOA52_000177 [Chlamydomonas sp. UWO 241]|nr:hypothetical protein FOA52_000177 [Chlamydomonas sp. UWO 241]
MAHAYGRVETIGSDNEDEGSPRASPSSEPDTAARKNGVARGDAVDPFDVFVGAGVSKSDDIDPFDLLVSDRHGQQQLGGANHAGAARDRRASSGSAASTSSGVQQRDDAGADGGIGGAAGESAEEPGEEHAQERRELHIWAVPLFRLPTAAGSAGGAPSGFGGAGSGSGRGEPGGHAGGAGGGGDAGAVECLVFLPVTGWREPKKERSGVSLQIHERVQKLHIAAADKWQKMGEEEKGVARKVHDFGQRIQEDMTPEERLTSSIPKNVSKIIIHHPTSVGPDLILEKLQATTRRHGTVSTLKAGAAALVLPLALGMDTLIIPGPGFTSSFLSFQLWKNSRSAIGSNRLAAYIKQDGNSNDVRVNYWGDARLDAFYTMAQESTDGCLCEAEIEALVGTVKEEELRRPLIELRARHLRDNTTTNGDGYTQLAADGK